MRFLCGGYDADPCWPCQCHASISRLPCLDCQPFYRQAGKQVDEARLNTSDGLGPQENTHMAI